MTDASFIVLAFLVSIAGMAHFALSIGAHWQQFFGRRPHTSAVRVTLRLVGSVLLAIAFWLCALADPVPMAALVWPMLLTVAAVVVAALLTLHANLKQRGTTNRR